MSAQSENISAKPWFRMYREWINDPKVQMMSEADQRRLHMLFCLRGSGEVEPSDELIVFTLRISPEEWARSQQLFIEKGFIDVNNRLRNWEKRQFESDTSAERMRRLRDRNKDQKQGVTPPSRHSDAYVTPPDNREQNTETEEDTPQPPSEGGVEGEPEDETILDSLEEDRIQAQAAALALIEPITEAYNASLGREGWTPTTSANWSPRMKSDLLQCLEAYPEWRDLRFWRGLMENKIRGSDWHMGRVADSQGQYFRSRFLGWLLRLKNAEDMAERQPPASGSLRGSLEFLQSLNRKESEGEIYAPDDG